LSQQYNGAHWPEKTFNGIVSGGKRALKQLLPFSGTGTAGMTTPFAREDVWLAAINALPDDPRPIAALLRSDTPLPAWARYELADAIRAAQSNGNSGDLA
jgi:hypothetical protein